MNRKCISPVLATSLLLVVAVIAIVGFSNWFGNFQSNINSNIEQNSENIDNQDLKIDTIINNKLYVKASDTGTTIKGIIIDGKTCNQNTTITSIENIDLSDCLKDSKSGKHEITIQTDKKTYQKSFLIDNKAISTSIMTSGLKNGLVGHWDFTKGTAKDLSENNNDGKLYGDTRLLLNFDDENIQDRTDYDNVITKYGNPKWTTNNCVSGGCYEFDGVDDYIIINTKNLENTSDSFSINTWVKLNENKEAMVFIEQTQSFRLMTWKNSNGAYPVFDYKNTSNIFSIRQNTEILNLSQWYHIVGVKENNIMKVYINGKLSGEKTTSGNLKEKTQLITIGRRDYSAYSNFSIDEVAIYSKALSQEEITDLYNSKKAKLIEYKDDGLEFNGVDNYIEVRHNNNLNLLQNISVFAKFNYDPNKLTNTLISKSDSTHPNTSLCIDIDVSGSKFRFFRYNLLGAARGIFWGALESNDYIKTTSIYNGKKYSIYQNNKIITESNSIDTNIISNIAPLKIGTRLPNGNRYFKGTISEIRLYNRTLTDEEIKYLN